MNIQQLIDQHRAAVDATQGARVAVGDAAGKFASIERERRFLAQKIGESLLTGPAKGPRVFAVDGGRVLIVTADQHGCEVIERFVELIPAEVAAEPSRIEVVESCP